MTRVVWVVDAAARDLHLPTGYPNVYDAALELGFAAHAISGSPAEASLALDTLRGPETRCVVAYGSHQFLGLVQEAGRDRWFPVASPGYDSLTYSAYAPVLRDLLLNPEFVVLPYQEALRRGVELFGETYFLKPNAADKAFPGLLLTPENASNLFESLRRRGVAPDLLCVLAPGRQIRGEFRFVLAGGEVVAGSQYVWDGRLDVRRDVLPVCAEVAAEVARRLPDDWCVTCDVAVSPDEGEPRVVELNPFASSGLYACDTRAVVQAVSAVALRNCLPSS